MSFGHVKMTIGSTGKKYGLIKPGELSQGKKTGFSLAGSSSKASKKPLVTAKSVFGFGATDDDETANTGNGDDGGKLVDPKLAMNPYARRHSKLEQQRVDAAVAQDPTVFDYDGVYDSMKAAKEATADAKREKKREPKYVSQLLARAKEREIENDIYMQRKYLREAKEEEEQNDAVGSERFVTSAYKKKLAEIEQWKSDQAKLEKEEQAAEVTKRTTGLQGFYSGLLTKNVAMGSDTLSGAIDSNHPENTIATEGEVTGATAAAATAAVAAAAAATGAHAAAPGAQAQGGATAKKEEELELTKEEYMEAVRGYKQSDRVSVEDQRRNRLTAVAAKRQTSEGEVSDAKARYLARKKAKLEQQK